MSLSEILALYDVDQRQEIEYPDTHREVTAQVVRHVPLTRLGEGFVLYSRLDSESLPAAIEEQIAFFEGIGLDFEWKVYEHDTPPDLKERLAERGFEVEDAEAIMVLDLRSVPAVLLQPVVQDVRRITGPSEITAVSTVEETVWDEDFSWLTRRLAESLESQPESLSVYVAYVDGQPASSAWIFFTPHSQFASLWGGSTLPRFRRRGLYTALLAVRVQEALGRGLRYLTVDASPMSRPILEKLGFRRITTAYACKWRAGRGQQP